MYKRQVYARQDPLKFCRRCVGGILFARKLFWPLETILLNSGILAEKIIQKENHVLSVDDLEQALELTDKNDIKDEPVSYTHLDVYKRQPRGCWLGSS